MASSSFDQLLPLELIVLITSYVRLKDMSAWRSSCRQVHAAARDLMVSPLGAQDAANWLMRMSWKDVPGGLKMIRCKDLVVSHVMVSDADHPVNTEALVMQENVSSSCNPRSLWSDIHLYHSLACPRLPTGPLVVCPARGSGCEGGEGADARHRDDGGHLVCSSPSRHGDQLHLTGTRLQGPR